MNSIKKKIIALAMVTFTITSCDLDINVDPNSPATMPSSNMLTSAQVAIFSSFGVGASGLGQAASIWTHQTMIRSSADFYASTGSDANIGNPWTNLYVGALKDLETIITQSTEKEEWHYVGIAQVLKAFSYMNMVDVWGDIPFSEAAQGPTLVYPKFDDDAQIYPQLITLIDAGIANLAKTQGLAGTAVGTDDLVYGGNRDRWRKFAKVLKVKIYNTMRKAVPSVNADLITLLGDTEVSNASALVPSSTAVGGGFADDFELNYVNVAAPANRNPGWLSVSGATTYFSRWFYEILSNRNAATQTVGNPLNPIYAGIADPRLFYYMYNSLGSSNPNPQNPTEIRDGNYLAINFSSNSVNQGFDQARGLSMPGLYYCGGKFDNAGVGGSIVVGSAAGNAPQRLLCRYEVLYIFAELVQDGVIGSIGGLTASQLLSNGIDISFDKVNAVKNRVFPSAPAIDRTTTAAINYRNAVVTRFNAATATGKLEHILTQKWIANFGNPLSAYTDYRRTGFPTMLDPANDNDPNTNVSRAYPFSYPWRQLDTQQLNPNAPPQKLIGDPSAKVFWDVN